MPGLVLVRFRRLRNQNQIIKHTVASRKSTPTAIGATSPAFKESFDDEASVPVGTFGSSWLVVNDEGKTELDRMLSLIVTVLQSDGSVFASTLGGNKGLRSVVGRLAQAELVEWSLTAVIVIWVVILEVTLGNESTGPRRFVSNIVVNEVRVAIEVRVIVCLEVKVTGS